MPETTGARETNLLAWLVAGGASFLAMVVASFRWLVRSIAMEVIAAHNDDENAHRKAADKNHGAIEDDLDRLTVAVTQMHEDVALLIQAHNSAIENGTCPTMVSVRPRRTSDPDGSDFTRVRTSTSNRPRSRE